MTIENEVNFAMVPQWVLESGLPDKAVRLYAHLNRFAGLPKGAIPSRRKLAGMLDCSVRTVDRLNLALEDIGALERKAQYDVAGDRTSNLYVLRQSPPGGVATPVSPPSDTGDATGGDTHDATGGDTAVALKRDRVERETDRKNEPLPAAPRPGRGRNPAFDALAEECGRDPSALTKSASQECGTKLAEIRAALAAENGVEAREVPLDALGLEIRLRAIRYRRAHPTWELTPSSLAKWWDTLAVERPAATRAPGRIDWDAVEQGATR